MKTWLVNYANCQLLEGKLVSARGKVRNLSETAPAFAAVVSLVLFSRPLFTACSRRGFCAVILPRGSV